MKRKMEQLRNGKFEYELSKLTFSQDKIEIKIMPGEKVQGELFFRAEDGSRIKGYIHSSSRRMIPAAENFSGTAISLPYGVDGVGMNFGERCQGELTFISNMGEYAIPFIIAVDEDVVETSKGEVRDLQDFSELAKDNYREAFRLFTGESLINILGGQDDHMVALYRTMTQNPVTYQHLEEFLIGAGQKEPVEITLPEKESFYYELKDSVQGSLPIHREGWGYTRLEVETEGEFVYVQKKVITQEDFIGSAYNLEYVVMGHKLGQGRSTGRIHIHGPYGTLTYEVTASKYSDVNVSMRTYELIRKAALYRDFLNLRLHKLDFKTWTINANRIFRELDEAGCGYPIYRVYEAFCAHMNEDKEKAVKILMEYQDKSFTKEDIELAGMYLYACYLAELFTDKEKFINRLNSLYRQQPDSSILLWILLQEDGELQANPREIRELLRSYFAIGGCSPLLYLEAFGLVKKNVDLLDKMDGFWTQVMFFAAKDHLVTQELAMRIAYLSGYEKGFQECLYQVLARTYEKYPTKDILEAICKLTMKGRSGERRFFPWYERAVEQDIHLTRLYECYIETIDSRYQKILPQTIRKYFSYNNSLSDNQKAFVYANVVRHKNEDRTTYANYSKTIHDFAYSKLLEGKMNEDYSVLYQEMATNIQNEEERQALCKVVFTRRLYCDNRSIRNVIIRQGELNYEEIYTCRHGVAYPQIYTDDAVIVFQDNQKRRFMATIDYNLRPLFDVECVEKCSGGKDLNDGFLLYQCQSKVGEITEHNLSAYEQLAASQGFTDSCRQEVLKKLLIYYRGHLQLDAVEKRLANLDYDSFAQVNKRILIEMLVEKGMMSQAYEILCKYGGEGVECKILLKLCSRIIMKYEFVEDDELLALAYEVFSNGVYDEIVLHYLMLYYMGPCRRMFELWQKARGFQMDTYGLEEKILAQLVFVENYSIPGGKVLESYYQGKGLDEVILGYLSFVCYGYFVKGKSISVQTEQVLEKYYEQGVKLDMVCKVSLLKLYASKSKRVMEQNRYLRQLLEDCYRHHLSFAFLKKLPQSFLSPYQLDDKMIVEYKGSPYDKVILYYRLDSGLGKDSEYTSEPLKNIYQGYFHKNFIMFYGETLYYYFLVKSGENSFKTAEKTIVARSTDDKSASRYQLINKMLSARKFGKTQEVKEQIMQYRKRERFVQKLFSIKKEGHYE